MSTYEDFIAYIAETKLTFSYKMVILQILIDEEFTEGCISKERLISEFREFYLQRKKKGLIVERDRDKNPSPLLNPDTITDNEIWSIMERYPLDLMKEFLEISDHRVCIKSGIQQSLTKEIQYHIISLIQNRLNEYYN